MTPRAWARPLVALFLLVGCQGYVRSSAPLAPSAEIVRIPFARPQMLVLAHGDGARGSPSDTIRGATAVYGRVVRLEGDTLRMVVTQVARSGTLRHFPSGRHAAVDIAETTEVQRWGHDARRTTALGVVVGGVLVAAGLFFASLLASVR